VVWAGLDPARLDAVRRLPTSWRAIASSISSIKSGKRLLAHCQERQRKRVSAFARSLKLNPPRLQGKIASRPDT